MQTVTPAFQGHATADVRPLSWACLISFRKTFDSSIDFFTIGVSTIGGSDIIKGEGDALQEWDKYDYEDFSDRIISIEWVRDQDSVASVSLAMADIVLDNHDGLFTPQAGSVYQDYILPYRPIKIYAGFNGENVPVFVGLTEKMPEVDEKSKTVKFHCVDFLYSLFNRPLDETVIFEDYRTDQVLDELLQVAGLVSSQYNLDTGFNIIEFTYFPKGTKLREAISELMEAEQGRFYMDETGVIQFKNRQNFSDSPVKSFDYSNIIDVQTSKQDEIINIVEVKSNVREVQANQKIWEMQSPQLVPANSTLEIWADFDDPVTTCDDPVYITSATTSLYSTNVIEDGTGDTNSGNISLTTTTLFAQSFKMIFTNASSIPTYITTLELFARPAKIVKQIYLREQDDASVTKYDERLITIENNFIQNETEAYSKALILLGDYSEYGAIKILDVKGNMAIQINDAIEVDLPEIMAQNYIITKVSCKIMGGRFSQLITSKQRDPTIYFTVGVSTIGGTDVIAP